MATFIAEPHALPLEELEKRLETNLSWGLTEREVRRRLAAYGPNVIQARTRAGFLSILISQWKNPMILLLMAATALSAFMGEAIDAAVIASIVLLNGFLGAVQEYKAEKAIESLAEFLPPVALVFREGKEKVVPAEEVVPGDVMIIRAGMRAVADARLIQSDSLRMDESSLTGESVPVSKDPRAVCAARVPIGDRKNMIHAGSLVLTGWGRAVVTATGEGTEMGRIAALVGEAEPGKTPLEVRLEMLGKLLLGLCVAAAGVTGVVGLFRGYSFHDMLLLSVSLAVAAVPEGLPAIVTLCLAMGVQKLARQGAVIRRLEAVETLGSVTVICTDKTGTLTRNRMEVVLVAPAQVCEDPALSERLRRDAAERVPETGLLRERELEILTIATLASDATLPNGRPGSGDGKKAKPAVLIPGEDPTEKAIVVGAAGAGIDVLALRKSHPRLGEKPFSPERRMMSTKVRYAKGAVICVKGAPDAVIPLCSRIRGAQVRTFTEKDRRWWDAWVNETAARGIRILAVASREISDMEQDDQWERDLTFLGCIGLLDPPRPEARETVERCSRAGIRVVLVTGDHLKTAENVARSAGIMAGDERGVSGPDLDGLSETSLAARISSTSVLARVSPAHKLKIVRALKKAGHVVAMTGDGVNDAPALKEAAVGIAMGTAGTDVAREAAAMVLLDDNLATIVRAVEEGRAVYDNIRKSIRYLLSCNLGEVLAMLGALLLELPLPLSPVQLLWMNLVTDGLPALALSLDPPVGDLMKRKPRDPGESLVSGGLLGSIVRRGLYIGAATLLMFFWALGAFGPAVASTVAFATLVTAQLVSVFDARSESYDITELNPFSNLHLIAGTAVSWLGLLAVVQVPSLSRWFNTVPLTARQWGAVWLASVMPQVARIAFRRTLPPSRPRARVGR